jgi:hypothetical protein
MRIRTPFCWLPVVLTLFFVASCGGGGGGGGPANPASRPTATTTTNLDGYWVCVSSELVATNTAFPEPIEPGEVFLITNGQLIGSATTGQSGLRVDLEAEFGFALGWYSNSSSGGNLDYHVGYDRLREGAGEFYDYINYGLRLAATGADTLIAVESEVAQLESGASAEQWTFGLVFERTTEPRAAAEAYETRMGEPFVPREKSWTKPTRNAQASNLEVVPTEHR